MVMSLMPKFLIRQSYFRLVASLSGVFLVFQGLVWVLVSSIIEETLWEANVAELYSLTLELERGHLHDHGGDVLWGVGDNIDPSIRRAFMDGKREDSFLPGFVHVFELYEAVFHVEDEDLQLEDSDEEEGSLAWGEIFEFAYEGESYIGEMSSDGQTLQYVAVKIDHQRERIEAVSAGIFFTTIVTFVSLVAISYVIALSSQRKVTKIQTVLSLLSDGDLSARCDLPPNNDDLSSIARRLDDALERLEVVTEQTRLFGKNLAHDLRTPLARLRASLEGSEKRHDDLTAALTEVDRIASIIDAMMRIARLQSEVSTASVTPLRLTGFAQRLYETYEPVLPERKTLLLEVDGDWVIRADEVLLEQAIANLLQNAIVHGGDYITLFTSNGVIGISDDGPGVLEDQFDEIIKPSVRLDPSRGEDGAGLGLAFVKAVADHHGARLALERLMPRGLKCSLQFD